MSSQETEAGNKRNSKVTPDALLTVIRQLIEESARPLSSKPDINLDSHLERELGLDSLGRTELLIRLSEVFGIDLPDESLLAETPRELLNLLSASLEVDESEALLEPLELPQGSGEFPSAASTLMASLAWHRDQHPDRVHILHYSQPEAPEPISYLALWEGAGRIASGLWKRSVRPGDRVALMLPTGTGYFFSFFGILRAGAIPVPIYPPTRPSQLEEHVRRHGLILQNAGVRMLITLPEARVVARLLRTQVPCLQQIIDWAELDKTETKGPVITRKGEDIAFLQYTSGSTGDPKGVALTHENLLANIRAMGKVAEVTGDDVFVSWLPLYHDMGLIGAWLGSLYFGLPLVVMSPLHFLARPSRWLWVIHRHRGTLSASPNFGYELCLNKVKEDELAGLDLSSWRWAFNGAEPVSAITLRRFKERFAPYGLDAKTLAPVYGLAEAAVGLAFPPPGRGPLVDRVSRERFTRDGVAVPVKEGVGDALEIVACGQALPGYRIRVVDRAGRELPERTEGRLEFQGPSATSGYFNNPGATRELIHEGWLDTGDRAYIADGDLYITGRIKEMIIRGGRNIYPYEVEQALGELPGIRKGCVALFPADDPASGTERLVVVAESRESDAARRNQLGQKVRELITDLLDMPPDEVVLAPPHTVLKTSSGKLRRATMRTLYEQGRLGRDGGTLPWQVLRLVLLGMWRRLQRIAQSSKRYLFAAYGWTLFWLLVPLVWLSVVLLPRRAMRWRAIRLGIRILRGLSATTVQVEGLENLPAADQPCVLVANHSSYLDTLALIDAIPREFVYVAKRELSQKRYSRIFLECLDTLFVERFDSRRSAASAKEFIKALQEGRSLAFYPEGTFRAEPGLLPFHMGAFVAAEQSGVPVLPVAIQGTRSILSADSNFPHHGAVKLVITPPLWPESKGWAEAVRLQVAAREAIAVQLDGERLS
jgi:1-acyl-sn-glycerol-3-phosphate acyltransferase